MNSVIKNEFSHQTFQIKSALGNLIELVESWVLSFKQEEDRQKKLEELNKMLVDPELNISDEKRKAILGLLKKVNVADSSGLYSSSSFRKKMKDSFSQAIEKLHDNIDIQLKLMGKVCQELNTKIEPAQGLILAQEDERKRISREIHDGPAQSLANLTMLADFCLENIQDPQKLRKELLELKDCIIRSLKDIRRFIFDLRPMALDDLGLIPTLEQYLSGFKTPNGLQIPLITEGQKVPFSPEKELAVFRVIQEAVNNANRHAQAENIMVYLTFQNDKDCLVCKIKDDGVGFDVDETLRSYSSLKKLGLLSMEERINVALGEFSITSTKGNGTVIFFSVPIP